MWIDRNIQKNVVYISNILLKILEEINRFILQIKKKNNQKLV